MAGTSATNTMDKGARYPLWGRYLVQGAARSDLMEVPWRRGTPLPSRRAGSPQTWRMSGGAGSQGARRGGTIQVYCYRGYAWLEANTWRPAQELEGDYTRHGDGIVGAIRRSGRWDRCMQGGRLGRAVDVGRQGQQPRAPEQRELLRMVTP